MRRDGLRPFMSLEFLLSWAEARAGSREAGAGVRLLDLFCGSGIGAVGYSDVGFSVTGIDVKPQPNYPFQFLQDDALSWLESDALEGFDVIHASPPCQFFTRAKHLRDAQGGTASSLDLLSPTLELLRRRWSHKIFVVENVPGAKSLMPGAAVECGSAYSLGVRRHRLFLSNVPSGVVGLSP